MVSEISGLQEGKPGDQALLGGNHSATGGTGDDVKGTSRGRRDRVCPS